MSDTEVQAAMEEVAAPKMTKEEMSAANAKSFQEVTENQSIDEQAMTFLRAFVSEFQGNFEEILKEAENFKKFAEKMTGHIQELDEFEAHQFLEKRGEAKTVKDLREQLHAIDLDSNNKMAFIEFLLFKYEKTVDQLFSAKPNDALVKKLEKAIADYKAVFEEKAKKQATIDDLQAKADAGDKKAKAELKRLIDLDPAVETKNELGALHAKLAAKRALRNPEEEERRAFEKEQQRVEDEKRQQELDEKRKREESRRKLKEKASLWK